MECLVVTTPYRPRRHEGRSAGPGMVTATHDPAGLVGLP